MCRKAVWLIAALMGLVWLAGVAEGFLAGTPKRGLSVAPKGQGMVREDRTYGTDGTYGTREGSVTRHASEEGREPVGRWRLDGQESHAPCGHCPST